MDDMIGDSKPVQVSAYKMYWRYRKSSPSRSTQSQVIVHHLFTTGGGQWTL